jgi:oligopeptide/dipeptide ABC transporter ATP-binding protein
MPTARDALLDVEGLAVALRARPDERLVDGVSLSVARGECLGLVGESGSGKSLTLRALVGLLPTGVERVAGTLRFAGAGPATETPYDPARIRGRGIGMVFQDPARSLNPRLRIRQTIGEPLRQHRSVPRRDVARHVIGLLRDVGVRDPERVADAYPHQLSGGQRQRALIAAALACEPELLLCDEPTTALDVTTQAQILTLLRRLAVERGLALVFVSHDLAVIAQIADRVAVMYAGQIVETGTTAQALRAPCHPYTLGLVRSVPRLASSRGPLAAIPGRPPGPAEVTTGCTFAARCAFATDACRRASIPLHASPDDRLVRCIHGDRVAAARREVSHGAA